MAQCKLKLEFEVVYDHESPCCREDFRIQKAMEQAAWKAKVPGGRIVQVKKTSRELVEFKFTGEIAPL